jgi:hypothetical protein
MVGEVCLEMNEVQRKKDRRDSQQRQLNPTHWLPGPHLIPLFQQRLLPSNRRVSRHRS